MASLRNMLFPSRIMKVATNNFRRHFTVQTQFCAPYDPDGKTIINVLNNEDGAPLMINSYNIHGFRLNNDLFAVGPIAIFPRSILSWNVRDDFDINERSLSLFLHLAPKLDVLLIGISDAQNLKLVWDTRKSVYEIMKSKGVNKMNVEVLSTEKAVTTFNFLNAESRFVAAALVPPTKFSLTYDDLYKKEFLNKKLEKGDFLAIEDEDKK